MNDKVRPVTVQVYTPLGAKYMLWALIGQNLGEVLNGAGFDLGGICGGRKTCGKCKIKVNGQVNVLQEKEKEYLLPEELNSNGRLACYCRVEGDVDVYLYIDPQSRNDNAKTSGIKTWSTQHSWVESQNVFVKGFDPQLPVPIMSRVAQALDNYELDLTPDNIRELINWDRPGRPSLELNALVFNRQKVKYIGKKSAAAFGVAVDIGSTSLLAALMDLARGEVVAVASQANMQRVYGADIISRVSYSMENDNGLETLQQILVNNINSLVLELTAHLEVFAEDIYAFTVAGNPVMLHTLLGLSLNGFAAYPYNGVFQGAYRLPAALIGLSAHGQAETYILPQVGGFIGADTVACLLTLPRNQDERFLLIDIGTNGEVVLYDRGQMRAAAAAAGPAFEGGNITYGMRAASGAISHVKLGPEGEWQWELLDCQPIKGLCGTAVIDVVAELLSAGYLDSNGVLNQSAQEQLKIKSGSQGMEVVIDPSSGITFSQEDIRQVQLAKSALRTAIDLLCQQAGLFYEDLDHIYLAGTFGTYIERENAVKIGLLPPVDWRKIKHIGNAAALGTVMVLGEACRREEASQIAAAIDYVELAVFPDFQTKFLANLNFSC